MTSLVLAVGLVGTGWFVSRVPFQYQKENPPSSQSRPFSVTGFTGIVASIGWLAVFFLVLKLGVPVKKNHPVQTAKTKHIQIQTPT